MFTGLIQGVGRLQARESRKGDARLRIGFGELPARDVEGLRTFVRETRRAELTHWWAMACAPLFVLWNPPVAAALLVAYGVLVNLPFVLIQRYNRFRTVPLVERLERRGSLR